jgi:polyphosphate glucokinase
MAGMEIFGIDIGGSGIKGAPVNIETGELAAGRYRIPTPVPAKPDAVAAVVGDLVKRFDWEGSVGCGFPSVVQNGLVLTAANIHPLWIGTDAATLFSQETGLKVTVINDADAAGLAEMVFGAGRGCQGTVLMVTIGTGLGTAVFTKGQLLPNTELGHLQIRGKDAEHRASDAVRKEKDLSWKKYAKRLNEYLQTLEQLLWPDLIILGGGVIKEYDKFLPLLKLQTKVVPAELLNEAGIVGAALAARP